MRRLFPLALAAAALVFLPTCAVGLQPEGGRPPEPAFAAAGTAATADDAVKRAILSGKDTPRTVFDVRRRLEGLGGRLKPHIVANRGHDNPEAGSFSFFETYTGPMERGVVKEGELFFGHFSERRGDTLVAQQSFERGSLMIELIAWDYTKQLYNFWELVGTGEGSQWHYRGDSRDVLADIAEIHMGAQSPRFGARLRCSGCHTLGGPIMKELAGPHNDWWTDRHKLSLGTLRLAPGDDPQDPAHVAGRLFERSADAASLAAQVKLGTDRLVGSRAWHQGLGTKERLRSLFTTMEMNLATDTAPWPTRQGGAVALPRGFFVDERLAGPGEPVKVDAGLYARMLQKAGSRFAADEADLPETRHAFVVPTRAYVDDRVIDVLVREGLLDDELVADVLAVDFTTPIYSAPRASLLRFVPERPASARELRDGLVAGLRQAPEDAAARELLANLTDPARTAAFHRERARRYLETCVTARASEPVVFDWLRMASQRREETRQAETARNPRGTITEPGFRVIYPEDRLKPKAGALRLRPETCRCE